MISSTLNRFCSRSNKLCYRTMLVMLWLIAANDCFPFEHSTTVTAAEPPGEAPAASPTDPLDGALGHYQPLVFEQGERKLLYRWMQPQGLETSGNERYPLVIFLHGAGERGEDNQNQLKHGAAEFSSDTRREKFPAYVLFPQCPKELQWVETNWSIAEGFGTFPEKPSASLSLTLTLVDQILAGNLHDARIDHDRVYITGLSMGGYGTWHATALRPELFAAAAPVCGGGDPKLVDQYDRSLPIWAFHGDADTVVPVQRGREIVNALNAAGQNPKAKLTVYPGVKHNSWTPTYATEELYDWMFAQRRSKKDNQQGTR